MALKIVQFLTLVFTALALVPSGAHLFALPNKIGLPQEAYFIAQGIYRGWALLGGVLLLELLAGLVLAIMIRDQTGPFIGAVIAVIGTAAAAAIFFIWTYPANQATANWTVAPEKWQALRTHWEYSHAAAALVTFVSFCALAYSALASRD